MKTGTFSHVQILVLAVGAALYIILQRFDVFGASNPELAPPVDAMSAGNTNVDVLAREAVKDASENTNRKLRL